MDLVTNWCAQVASKHKVLFQQQLLSPSQCGHKHWFVQVLHLLLLERGHLLGPLRDQTRE